MEGMTSDELRMANAKLFPIPYSLFPHPCPLRCELSWKLVAMV